MRVMSKDDDCVVYLCERIMEMKKRLNITSEHMARLLGIEMDEWKWIESLVVHRGKSK